MRSGERRTLASRLTLTLVGVSALAAMLAATASLWLADTLLRAQIEDGVATAVGVLAVEVDELPRLIGPELEPEARELGISGRVAIVDREGRTRAGDPELRAPSKPCAVMPLAGGEDQLVCRHALEHAPELTALVATPAARLDAHRRPMRLAGAGVLLVVVVLAAIAGIVLARRMLAPLEQLRSAVADIDVRAAAAVRLPEELRFAELDALRDALAGLIERLTDELARGRRFSASAAHELRTPLTKIRTELELALEREHADEVRATLERLHRSTDHLVALSERLLTLATPGEALASTRATSLALLAEASLEHRSAEDRARIEVETGEADGLVRGDEVLLTAMLDNLIDNALKFSSGRVVVRVDERGEDVIVEVEDEGPGVADELAVQMFEPFQRSVAARAKPGVGLGLALVAHIVAAYGGEVGFVPGRERGACVRVRLPRVRGLR